MKKRAWMKKVLIWSVAVIFTLAFAVYQRMTGPTYPIKDKIEVGNSSISYTFLRSWGGDDAAPIKIKVPNNVDGFVKWKRFKSHDEWTITQMKKDGDFLHFGIPHQPPAGKVMYEVFLVSDGKEHALQEKSVIIRFKGHVPNWIVILHVFFIFGAMLMSTRTGIEAIISGLSTYKFTIITVVFWIIGGFVFGPIMQKYAFGAYWTGWPFGHDLTDNKSLVALIFWIFALYKLYKNPTNKWAPFLAAVIMIGVFLIPHSVLGSELDYTAIEANIE